MQIKELILSFAAHPIGYRPMFGRIAGCATSGLFLSQLFYWTGRQRDPKGWIYKSYKEWEKETSLSRSEIDRARRDLKKKGLIEDDLRGTPATLYYRLNLTKLAELAEADYLANPEIDDDEAENQQPVCGIEQPTTETTSETTHRTKKARLSPEENAAVRAVMSYFTELTGLKPIGSETQVRWRVPAEEILKMVEWDTGEANRIVLAAYKKMKEDHLTYNSIQSIVRMAAFVLSQETAPVRSGMKAW